MGKFLLVVIVFAALVYAVFWLIERRRGGSAARRRSTCALAKPTPRTVAPDDDEDFLRDLNRRNRGATRTSRPNDLSRADAGSQPPA